MDIKEKVLQNLKSFGLDSDIKPITLKHLEKIEEVLINVVNAENSAIQTLKSNRISINRVAKESGIARQTFYNNPIIAAYVQKYIEENLDSNPYETIDALREELRRKDEQIAALVKRDATISQYKAKNKALADEIAALQATIKLKEPLPPLHLKSKRD